MTHASDIYTLYLKPYHLPKDGQQVVITAAQAEDLHPRPNETKPAIVLSFQQRLAWGDGFNVSNKSSHR